MATTQGYGFRVDEKLRSGKLAWYSNDELRLNVYSFFSFARSYMLSPSL
jgi:hypothetical protein